MTAASRHLNHPARAVADRLRQLGYPVADVPEDEHLPSQEEIVFLGTDSGIADLDRPVPLARVARAANAARISLAEAADRMARLGHRFTFAPEAVASLRVQDARCLYFSGGSVPETFGRVRPDTVRAVAHHTGREYDEIADSLAGLGFDVVLPTEEWTRQRSLEDSLFEALSTPDQHPIPFGRDSRTISLVTLAMAAMRAGSSLRAAASMATELGMRHEAETWFSEPPGEPAAPWAAAVPPG
ncbi:hypothetical protein ABZ471_03430 [Streptomyces sp. NPDC005728]|uniref:wHTH domain-containing protein n=1 Tax=Streptomyces sp. NPDC005728 TaxID=3157054 RepID=UPI00340D9ABC